MFYKKHTSIFAASLLSLASLPLLAMDDVFESLVFQAGHPSLKVWLLPDVAPAPTDNLLTPERAELGKMLFFDPRLSGDGNMSCASCHNPMLGWSDSLPTARGFKSQVLGRATPTITNTAFNSIQMWDGRKKDLEDQALGPMQADVEMHTDFERLLAFLREDPAYIKAFDAAYPGEGISEDTLAKAIASFERTVISNDSPFDRWVRGDSSALTAEQVEGFRLFVRADKGNCAVCHSAPNFTDNGFHNLGLKSFGSKQPDMGRFVQRPLQLMKGAFKTPTLRDITLTAPYFHDGSASTLDEVMDHYIKGGEIKTNLSPNMKALDLSANEKQALIEFLKSLTTPVKPLTLPLLSQHEGD